MIEPAAIDHAIAGHAKWKFRLRQAIDTGRSEWTPDAVRPDNQCEFGRWLHGLPLHERQGAHGRAIRDLHAEFHRTAAEVLEHALAGRKDQAAALMAAGGAFAHASSKLTVAMTAWKKDLAARPPG
jgi:hypothetical protein